MLVGKVLWLLLIVVSGVWAVLYLFFTLLPGPVDPAVWQYFTKGEVNSGLNYHQLGRLVYILGFAANAAVLIFLILSPWGMKLSQWSTRITGGNKLLALLVFFGLVWLLLRAADLPFTLLQSYVLPLKWHISTQGISGWWADYAKSGGLDLVLSAAGVVLFFWSTGRWPASWWIAASILTSVWIIVQTYLWPVIIAPIFNRFVPATDPAIVQMVDQVSSRAGISVKQVLVMDASSRTTTANAYFAGLGKTKRIVLYDNLLESYSPEEIKAVIAHETAHWRQRHIFKGMVWGIIGSSVFWLMLFLFLRLSVILPRSGPYPQQIWPMVLLFFLLSSFAISPLQSSLSRLMEAEADLVAKQLTGNPQAMVSLQVNLARKNIADVSPPPFIEWFSYSHPSTIRRISKIAGD